MITAIKAPVPVTKVLDFIKSDNKGSCDLHGPVGHGYFTMLINGLNEANIDFNTVYLNEMISDDFNVDGSSVFDQLNYHNEVIIMIGADGCDPKINVNKYAEYLVKNGCKVVTFHR